MTKYEEDSLNKTFQDIMDQVGGINSECNDIIEKFQNEQLDALRIEVDSLRQQNERQKQLITQLKNAETELRLINENMKTSIDKFKQCIDSKNNEYFKMLADIENNESLPTKIDSFIEFIKFYYNNIKEKDKLTGSSIQDYIQLLLKVANKCNLDSNITNSNEEESQVPCDSLKVLLDEVKNTSQLLQDKERNFLYNVSDFLDLKVDNQKRIKLTKKILSNKNISYEEMKLLYIQEISITIALKKFANKCINTIKESNFEKSKLISLHSLLSKLLKKGNSQYSLPSLIKMVNQLSSTYVEYENNKKGDLKNNREVDDSSKDWQKWAKSLFYAITGENSNSFEDIKITIEEASLAATGNKWCNVNK